jgi:aspartyl protease family protein
MRNGWFTLGQISGTVVILGGAIVSPMAQPTLAQSSLQPNNGCFMVTESGRSLNLDKLCNQRGVPAMPNMAPAPQVTAPTGAFQARIKRRLSGIPVIDVTFNGNRTYEMIVDTGASGTLITQAMASALRVPIIGRVESSIADGSTVVFPVGQLRSMAVSGAEVQNVRVAIAARMDIGLLGHDFFSNYDVKIKRDVVEFYPR